MAALLLTVFIWGSTFVATKDALQALPPATLALWRFGFAALVLSPLFYMRRKRSAALPVPTAALMGFTGVFLFFALQNWALLHCRAGTASLILAAVPAFTAIASFYFLGERVGGVRVAGIVLTMLGVAALVWSENGTLLEGSLNIGALLLIGSAMAWAVYTVLGRKFSDTVDPVVVTFQGTLWGILYLLPFALLERQPDYLHLGWEPWAVILYLGVVASALPIVLWNYALRSFEASEAGLYLNLIPIMAIILAALLLGERLRPVEIAAGLTVLIGVILAERQKTESGGSSMVVEERAAR